MLRHLRNWRQRLRDRATYERLVARLEQINAADVSSGASVTDRDASEQAFGCGPRS